MVIITRPHVVSAQFAGKTRVQQHQMVYQALAGAWAGSCTRSL